MHTAGAEEGEVKGGDSMEQFAVREYIVREIGFPGVLKQEIVGEIVRCKDCKYRKGTFHADRRMKEGGYWVYWCELDTGDPFELGRNAQDDNWFCGDGEWRTDDDRNG